MKHISNQWDRFVMLAMPEDAPAIQIREMRNAFYAGVAMVFQEITQRLEDPGMSNEEGGQFLREIHDEINAFILPNLSKTE